MTSEHETTTTQAPSISRINPDEWGALGNYVYDGLTYGRGEPVPDMPVDFAAAMEHQGLIARRTGPSGALTPPTGRAPTTPVGYLSADDAMVLRMIRQHRPAPQQIRDIAALAKQQDRSQVLQEALTLVADLAAE